MSATRSSEMTLVVREHDHRDIIRERRHHHVREEVVNIRQHPVHASLSGRYRAKLVDTLVRERHAAVPAESLNDVQVVELDGIESLPMSRTDVIALKETFNY